ncbi:replication initiator protein [Microviridae sp.]|nr:replication initiator protein [Microviridae sp.]
MTCYYGRPAWRVTDPEDPASTSITFTRKGEQLNSDFVIPCGKCIGCQASRKKDWAIRMYHEAQYHEQNSFLTLTYANDPKTLHVSHVQNFLKRLRKHGKIRHFITGEYGEKTHRPHYHAIIFGADFRGGSFAVDDRMYGNEWLNRIWGKGDCVIGDFSMQSACYVAGYVNKKIADTDTFSIMSRRPPLGYQWALDNADMLNRNEAVTIEGSQYPIPKVYFDWSECSAFRPGRVDLDGVKANRRSHVRHLNSEQLRAKEYNHRKRDNLKPDERI